MEWLKSEHVQMTENKDNTSQKKMLLVSLPSWLHFFTCTNGAYEHNNVAIMDVHGAFLDATNDEDVCWTHGIGGTTDLSTLYFQSI